ncbi:band 7 protein CG42540-like isoform X1 [Tigriopus californicus]|uniref:band 7 protein CG42540-like isoform X1 n=1 Tax=Tigriopus californicus TaxID=6832 RepID=UPI0027D9E41F|nr:band 7 protein CG42540-like isoform X1 [Tigriopus californicus]
MERKLTPAPLHTRHLVRASSVERSFGLTSPNEEVNLGIPRALSERDIDLPSPIPEDAHEDDSPDGGMSFNVNPTNPSAPILPQSTAVTRTLPDQIPIYSSANTSGNYMVGSPPVNSASPSPSLQLKRGSCVVGDRRVSPIPPGSGLPPAEPLANPRRGSTTGSFGLPVPPDWVRAQNERKISRSAAGGVSMEGGGRISPGWNTMWQAYQQAQKADKRLLRRGTPPREERRRQFQTNSTASKSAPESPSGAHDQAISPTKAVVQEHPQTYSQNVSVQTMQEEGQDRSRKSSLSSIKDRIPFYRNVSVPRPPPSALIQEPEPEKFEETTCWKILNFLHLSADPEGPGCCALLLALVSILLIIATLPFSLCMCIKVVQEYERSVIFRLGRLRKGGAKGPGIFFIIPCIDTYRKVDLRTVSFDVPPQEVLSRDSVTVTVDAVVYYRVSNPTMATNNVEDFSHSTHLLAATTLRNVLGTKHLAEILSERETISHVMEQTLDEATDPWGVKVERVEIKDVRLPVQLQRAMAAEAEAAREARAKVIAAEGEQKASRALREASDVISESPSALQLRYLQTLNTISAEKNSTIIFPVPLDIISHFFTGGKKQA